ncbi:MAG: glyoxalase/bleomycin resistance/extradiol dioxygenase family protein [Acidobacteria bacterium]|nr:glyoxalase/bleomycin resistance/extradiol dioxygenase family protein [Acidobacteriota bacterium]
MSTMIFVNLPVKDLDQSKEFYARLGFTNNPQFTDDTAACMVLSEQIYVMLLTHPKFQGFAPHPIGDAKQTTQSLYAVSRESKEGVDAIVDQAVAAGATTFSDPIDYGFMYSRSFQDLDGHVWEWVYMNMEAMPQQA